MRIPQSKDWLHCIIEIVNTENPEDDKSDLLKFEI